MEQPRLPASAETQSTWIPRRRARSVVAVGLAAICSLLAFGCSQTTDLERAERNVKAKQDAVTKAQSAYDTSRSAFCAQATRYVSALDRYGKLFTEATATVGDVRTLGADLQRPQDEALSAANSAVDAHTALLAAKAELDTATRNLDAIKAGETTTKPAPTTSTTTTLLPTATVDAVRSAEAAMTAALGAVTDQTPLVQAGQQVNSAAFALEIAWLRVLSHAGCLTDEQQVNAQQAVAQYTAAVQSALKVTGHYTGPVDGIYGPSTTDAVAKFQSEKGLPATGYVDRATATALQAALEQRGGTAAAQAIAQTAALQTVLHLAGYWAGPIDGQWTDALTSSLKSFQTSLGVPATGVVDVPTMEALRAAIAQANQPATTTTTPTATTPTSTAPSSTPPASTTSTTHP